MTTLTYPNEGMSVGWAYSEDYDLLCQVIETQALWGETACRIRLPGRDSVIMIPASRLKSLPKAALEHGKPICEALAQERQSHIAREREQATYVIAAHRRTVELIDLPQARNYCLKPLVQEGRSFQGLFDPKGYANPELPALLVIRVQGGGHD